jgi:hypothetical protein
LIHMFLRHLLRIASAIILSGLVPCAQAVELGDAQARSHIGQPLSADIELTGLASDSAPVQAALADPDVYRGASLVMHPALAGLNITIVRRDGRRFMHIASPKTVDADHLLMFFALTENGQRSVRQVTLWLTPDPNPVPPPPKVAPVAVAPPAPVPVPVPVPAPAPKPVIAAPVAPPVVHMKAPAPAPQPFTAAQIRTAALLDAKNAALSGRIVELEEKVKTLGAALQSSVAPASAPKLAPAPAVKPRPVAKPLPAKLAPMGEPVKKNVGTTPWLFIGIAGVIMLALAGLLALILRGKRKAKVKVKESSQAAMPRFIASVRDRLKPAPKKEVETEAEVEAVPG